MSSNPRRSLRICRARRDANSFRPAPVQPLLPGFEDACATESSPDLANNTRLSRNQRLVLEFLRRDPSEQDAAYGVRASWVADRGLLVSVGVSGICAGTKLCRRSVRRALDHLIKVGMIEIAYPPDPIRVTTYRILTAKSADIGQEEI